MGGIFFLVLAPILTPLLLLSAIFTGDPFAWFDAMNQAVAAFWSLEWLTPVFEWLGLSVFWEWLMSWPLV